jgi:hypothetical protein
MVNQESDKGFLCCGASRLPKVPTLSERTLSGTAPRWSVGLRGKDNIPEQRRRRKELDRNQRAFLIHLRRTDHIHFDLLLRSWIFECELRALGNSFAKNDHRAGRADRMRKSLDGLGIIGHVYQHRHPQEHALRAPPLFGSRLPRRRCGTYAAHAADRSRSRVRRRLQV